ncbi:MULTISPECIES: DNA polymerase III subunit chi [Lysobacteraceae]|uniref:DNA polymerase III subunit chi n=1 Tax=Novilysobacter avium TaxID=2781023 RepID=A0A7S6ULH2_9GAMM|nr:MULTISPECIES: DNA polymerase III subunit chi [Lysobacter]QOW22440.1 DNA polymerase III subunit chi [Lysobacter avium]QOW24953.1 DNA polymerase III subunit chi [Lysobacter sp. H23M47]QOY63110.1 DNA polymerase III subunit chi [Lysobacter sp. H21R4]
MRADFYLIQKPRFREEPLLLVCELARKAQQAGQACIVLARDAAQAEKLDDLLWSFDPDAFIPHQIVDPDMEEGDDEEIEVLIAAPEHDVALRPLVINLRDAAVDGAFERVLEVVPADDSARGPLRQRWVQYKDRGFTLNKHDM